MIGRRSFLAYGVGMLASVASAQTSVMKGEKAVTCTGSTTKCPNGHTTCRNIDLPLVVGEDNRNYPNWSVLFDYRLMFCTQCLVVFVEKQ